jgi:hypothetical protein
MHVMIMYPRQLHPSRRPRPNNLDSLMPRLRLSPCFDARACILSTTNHFLSWFELPVFQCLSPSVLVDYTSEFVVGKTA